MLLCCYIYYYYIVLYINKIPGARKFKLKFNLRIKNFKGFGRRYGMCLTIYIINNNKQARLILQVKSLRDLYY